MAIKRKKAVFNWSGGKDSALALYKALQSGEYEILSLLTTVNSDTRRSSMHAISVSLLQTQDKRAYFYLITLLFFEMLFGGCFCKGTKKFNSFFLSE